MSTLQRIVGLLSEAVNAFAFGGDIDETLSARAWRLKDQEKWSSIHRFIDSMPWFGLGHCKRAWEAQKAREVRRKGASIGH